MTISSQEPTIAQLFDLTGRVAMVTGGCGHLGKALCIALAESGATVIVTSREEERAQALAKDLPSSNKQHLGVGLDHMEPETLEGSFTQAVAQAGRIDILVNNGHAPSGADWTTTTPAEFNRQLANATGYFTLSRLLHDHAVARGVPASIILLGSMYGLVGSYPETYAEICAANPVAYQTLKGGILQMTRHLAVYWAKDQVRVNSLSPGPFPSNHASPKLVERLCAKSPMGRMGQPHELKGAVVFLASDASSYITGHNLVVDGGWTAW